MAVPIALNVPLNNATNLSSDIEPNDLNKMSNGHFSEQFDSHVNRLKDRENSTKEINRDSSKNPIAKPPSKASGSRGEDSKNVAKNNNSSDKPARFGDRTDGSVGADESRAETTGLSPVTTAIVDKGAMVDGLGLSAKSGNNLPITAESVPFVDGVLQTINENILDTEVALGANDIVFDPLAQAADSSVQIASMLVSNQLPVDKIKLNGKVTAGDFLNPFNAALSLDKTAQIDIPALMADKLLKVDGLTQGVNDFGLIKSSSTVDLPLNNVAGVTNQSINMTTLAADKPTLQLDVPVNSARWGQEFGQRIQWMVNQSVSGAQIRITPQHMGPIEVRVQMQNDQATIAFTAQHGATREAIDAALPRLREMLSDQNVNVVDVDISQHSFAEQRDQQAENQNADGSGLAETALDGEESIFDQQRNSQQRQYSGLFSDFA